MQIMGCMYIHLNLYKFFIRIRDLSFDSCLQKKKKGYMFIHFKMKIIIIIIISKPT